MNEKEFQKACHESKLLEIIWIRMDIVIFDICRQSGYD